MSLTSLYGGSIFIASSTGCSRHRALMSPACSRATVRTADSSMSLNVSVPVVS